MISPALVLPLALLFGPEAGRPPVQTPVVSPTQPQPGEPAIAPARIDGEAAIAEPAPMPIDPGTQPEPWPEPQPEPQPEPPPDGDLPSWQVDPGPTPPPDRNPDVDEWGAPLPQPQPKLPPKGGGFYAGAGALLGIMITKQWITALNCDDVYCGWRGNIDRGLGLGVMGLAAGGGWFDGRRAARKAYDAGKPPKPLTGRRAAGWSLFALGLGGLIADAVLYNVCYSSAV